MDLRFVFRVDAGDSVGLGHLSRCATLGEELMARGIPVTFATNGDHQLLTELVSAGADVYQVPYKSGSSADADSIAKILEDNRTTHLVVDGYVFDADYLTKVGRVSSFLTVVDDFVRLAHYPVDFLIDQNLGCEDREYPVVKGAKTLLGTEYLLLNRKYAAVRSEGIRPHGSFAVSRALIAMGGADLHGYTLKSVRAMLRTQEDIELDVVVGPGCDSIDELRTITSKNRRVNLHESLDGLSELISATDMSIVSGGVTMWELASLGVPSAVIIVAENQRPHTELFAEMGAVKLLGDSDTVNEDTIVRSVEELLSNDDVRSKMSRTGMQLIRADGVKRVADLLLDAG